MAIFNFFKTPQHKSFEYRPLYYNERKEAMKDRLAELENGEDHKKDYKPGQYIKGKIRRTNDKDKKQSSNSILISRFIIAITLSIFMVALFYVAKYFDYFTY